MTSTDYPLSQNPAYFETVSEKPWSKELRNIPDMGEGYNTLVIFWLSSDEKEIEIIQVRAVGPYEQPPMDELIDTAKAGLREEFGNEVEFDTTCQGT